jgi:hypothetical protein
MIPKSKMGGLEDITVEDVEDIKKLIIEDTKIFLAEKKEEYLKLGLEFEALEKNQDEQSLTRRRQLGSSLVYLREIIAQYECALDVEEKIN